MHFQYKLNNMIALIGEAKGCLPYINVLSTKIVEVFHELRGKEQTKRCLGSLMFHSYAID